MGINYLLLTLLILILSGVLLYRFHLQVIFTRRKKIRETRRKIIAKTEPGSMEETNFYEIVIDRNKANRNIRAWGTYILLLYYKGHYSGNKEIIYKSIKHGEVIRKNFKKFPFYEDALFALGNIYFFEIFDFTMASSIYEELIIEKENTRWKSICNDRIELIKNSVFDEDALKLYVFAEKYFEESRFEDAEFYLNEVIKRYPKVEIAAAASYFLGDINYYKYNDLDSALKYYKMTAEKFPHHTLAKISLYKVGEILRKLKNWEDAISIYREYLKIYKTSPYKDDAYYYIGECYYSLNKLRNAKNAFNLILGDYPNSKWTDVIYHKVQEINRSLEDK